MHDHNSIKNSKATKKGKSQPVSHHIYIDLLFYHVEGTAYETLYLFRN